MNASTRCTIPAACWFGLFIPINGLAAGVDELVIQNETAQRLVLQVSPSQADAAEEPILFEVAPHKWGAVKLKDHDTYAITLQWFAVEGQRVYEFRADDVRLREFIRISKIRPTTRLVDFQLVAQSVGTPLQRRDLPAEKQWTLALPCATTRTEAIVTLPRLAIADPSRPVPRARSGRRRASEESSPGHRRFPVPPPPFRPLPTSPP